MAGQISDENRRRIVRLRALDYTKQEIAEEIGISRNTVRRHLTDVREEVESSETPEMALADFLFDPNDLLPYMLEQSTGRLKNLDRNMVAVPIESIVGEGDEE